MRPIFSPIPILGNDMKVPKVTHRESPSYNNRFRDIMASRNPSLNPKPGDADNEEPDRIEESNKDEQDKVLIKICHITWVLRTYILRQSPIGS